MELNSHFQKFLSNIEPSSYKKSEASMGHNTLRERLQNDSDYKTVYLSSFISGSYGRDTAINQINDVDIIIITIYSENLQPDTALLYLEKILKKYYKSDQIKRQNRSIRITLSYITMDVVVAIRNNGISDSIKIPDRELKKWIVTNPRKHIDLATELNKNRDNLYKPLVKALKEWRDNRIKDDWKPKSFLLECMIYYYILENSISTIPVSINNFFWYIYQKYGEHRKTNTVSPVIWDPADTKIDVAEKWSYSDYCKFMDEIFSSWYVSYNAIKSEDYDDSIERWRNLLGNNFPRRV